MGYVGCLGKGTKPDMVCPPLLSKGIDLFNGRKGKYSNMVVSAQICGCILKTIAGTKAFWKLGLVPGFEETWGHCWMCGGEQALIQLRVCALHFLLCPLWYQGTSSLCRGTSSLLQVIVWLSVTDLLADSRGLLKGTAIPPNWDPGQLGKRFRLI